MAKRKNPDGPVYLSTHETARHLGVDMTTVISWCVQGKLASFKTPGGHRRIQINDLLTFLKTFHMPVPDGLRQLSRTVCLVVDDEKPIRTLVARVIRSVNPSIAVEEAENGFEAGQKLIELTPNLVILDINLPGLDGIEVCKNIRKNPRLKHTRILSISGQGEEACKEVLAAGADAFLAKPLTQVVLKEKIATFLT